MPLESRTRATFRRAEFGFLGVMILTCRHTPRFCGHPVMAGCLGLLCCCVRGVRTSWLIVGILGSSGRPAGGPARNRRKKSLYRRLRRGARGGAGGVAPLL